MNFRHFILTAIFSAILFYSCKDKSEDIPNYDISRDQKSPSGQTGDMTANKDYNPSMMVVENERELKDLKNYSTQENRMIIRTGNASVEVDKYDEAEAKLKEIAARSKGYNTHTSSSINASGKKQGTVTIRVPSGNFDALLASLHELGKVMEQNISGNDVTEEYMDADARLKTQRELEARLLKLLAEKTAKLTDIVEVESKLAVVRENIERTEGRMRLLKDQADFSTLSVSMYEEQILVTSSGGGFFYELGEAVKDGLRGFTGIIRGLITVLIALIPVFIILGVIFYFGRKYLKRRKRTS